MEEGVKAFTDPLLQMKQSREDETSRRKQEEQKTLGLINNEQGSTDVETLGKMTIATGTALLAGGLVMELAGVERTLNMPMGLGVGGLVVGACIYGAEKLINS